MGTNDRCKTIRKALKADLGANARAVSVRSSKYSLGATIHVTIKSARFGIADVERIARRVETVRRCEATGEILNGGNTYVSVRYADDAIAPLCAAIESRLTILGSLSAGTIETVFGIGVSRDDLDGFTVWGERVMSCWCAASAARTIAKAVLNGEGDSAHAAIEIDHAMATGHALDDAAARVAGLTRKAAA